MNTKNGVSDATLGVESEKKVLRLEDVKGLLKRDVHACILMLSAVHDDQDLLDALALSMHGKYLNRLHKAELEKQEAIEFGEKVQG